MIKCTKVRTTKPFFFFERFFPSFVSPQLFRVLFFWTFFWKEKCVTKNQIGEKKGMMLLRFVSSLKHPQHYHAFSGCAAARRWSCSSVSSSLCCSSYDSSRRRATTRCHATRAKDDDENDATKPVKKSIISSVENANVKRLVKLRTSKAFRDEERSVVVVGSTVLKEILRDGKTKVNVKSVYALDDDDDDDGRVDVFEIDHKVFFSSSSSSYGATAKVMKKLAGVENADGIDLVAELEMPEIRTVSEFMKRKNTRSKIDKVLCMDGVQDPGNVGTLLRTAEAFGFDAVGLGPRTCDPFNDKCMRSSKGTAFRMQMFNWKTSEEFFEGIVNDGKFELKENVLAAMLSGESCVDVSRELNNNNNNNNNNSDSNDYRSHTKVCLVLGSEGQGVSKEIASSTRAVTIPTPGVTESLNVAVAGGILMSSLTIR